MKARKFIYIPAISKDGELLPCVTEILIDANDIRISGQKCDRLWDSARWIFVNVDAFFIEYDGILYGMDITESVFWALVTTPCQILRIHTFEHAIEFD